MVKGVIAAFALICIILLSGCATSVPMGLVSTDVTLPAGISNPRIDGYTRKGEAECKSLLGLVAWGDASIDTAAKNGGLTKVWRAEYNASNICGIWGVYKVTVYGE